MVTEGSCDCFMISDVLMSEDQICITEIVASYIQEQTS